MKQYLELMRKVYLEGEIKENRTGINTRSIFGAQMRFDLRDGFPLLTTKKVHFKSVLHELLWFISGQTTTGYLNQNGITIWDEWATPGGHLGPIYGAQWRRWPKDSLAIERDKTITKYVDQLNILVEGLIKNPGSRRHIVSAWNPNHLPDESISPQENVMRGRMSLAPCHMMFQCNVVDPYIDLQMYQRSVDVFLGLPFNIASYAILLEMLGKVTNYIPRNFIWTGGDVHLYDNHLEQAETQLKRIPKDLPSLEIPGRFYSLDEFMYGDFILRDYNPDPHIKGDIAV